MKLGTLYGVGIGPGDPRYLTLRAVEVLQQVDVIFAVVSRNAETSVSGTVASFLKPRAAIRVLEFTMSRDSAERHKRVIDNANAIIAALQAGRDCAFATLGDATTYSTFGYVLRHIQAQLPQLEVEIVPGITSFATLAAKSKQVLVENGEQLRIIPSFRAEMADSLEFPEGSTTVLLKTYRSREALLQRLEREEGMRLVYGEHLAMEGEVILDSIESIRQRPEEYLSLIMVKK